MPPAKSRRVDQCCYSEDGRRCRRSATGNPPLCNPHRIAVAEQVRREVAGTPGGAGISELFDRLVSGRRVNRKVVESAIGDAVAWYAEWEANRRTQQPPEQPPPGQQQRRPRGVWWDPIFQRAQQASQVDPRVLELKQTRARARVTLGIEMTAKPSESDLGALRKKLARIHHPDRGGSPTKMQEINAAIDVLIAEAVERERAGVVT